jgi:hypothetical protein
MYLWDHLYAGFSDPGSIPWLKLDFWWTTWHCGRFILSSTANHNSILFHIHRTPPPPGGGWCYSPDRAGHYHALSSALGISSLTRKSAGLGVKVVQFICKAARSRTAALVDLWPVGPVPGTCVINWLYPPTCGHQSILSLGGCSRNHSTPVHHALTDIQPACLIVPHVLR